MVWSPTHLRNLQIVKQVINKVLKLNKDMIESKTKQYLTSKAIYLVDTFFKEEVRFICISNRKKQASIFIHKLAL